VTYAVKETFRTLQGEGLNAGRAAVFLRFAGCNLWTGREEDREKGSGGCARWCDTQFVGTDGLGGGKFATASALATHVADIWSGAEARRLVVCTGGEPLLQLDEALVDALHEQHFEVAIETNGTRSVPRGVDWVCVSPKVGAPLVLMRGNELKLVIPQDGFAPSDFEHLAFDHFLLQPMDGLARESNTKLAIEYCMQNPKWRLSLQTHKFLGIP